MDSEKYLIKNEFLKSSENVTEIINPFTDKTVYKVYKSTADDINTSLNYLTNVFGEYKKLPVYKKSDLLKKVADKMEDKREMLAEVMTKETGKPIKLARGEVDRAIFTFRCGAEEARRIDGEIIPIDQMPGAENKIGLIRRFPIGVILAITPWNFPMNLVAHKISPALASGNTVLLKPASASLVSGLEIVKIIKEVTDEMNLGYCPVNVVTCSGSEIEQFVNDDRIKLVSFTGSPAVGWNLKKKLSMQRISLELGGNAGVIVDESADIKTAAEKISIGAFSHAGQSCISVQRVFVHKNIIDEFKKIITDITSKIKYGDPFDEDTLVGPMINKGECKRIQRWIEEALNTSGEYLYGGKADGAVLEPTILINTNPQSNVNSQEVFAPLMTIREFTDFRQAVDELNNSDFGLQAGVFTNDFSNIMYAYENIETGGVVINDVSTFRMDSMPYGGTKHSGIGKEGVKYAIEEMTERKILIINK